MSETLKTLTEIKQLICDLERYIESDSDHEANFPHELGQQLAVDIENLYFETIGLNIDVDEFMFDYYNSLDIKNICSSYGLDPYQALLVIRKMSTARGK